MDVAYFFQNATMKEMVQYYAMYYRKYDRERFHKLASNLGLDEKRKISTFSKGMKRQAALILGIWFRYKIFVFVMRLLTV